MFQFPEPPPIGYFIDDVSLSFLSDGVLQHGKPGPSHKCIAQQLRHIPRKLSDPVAPKPDLEPRVLENWTTRSKAWYVDSCGRNARALHAMLARLPEEKIDLYYGWKSKCAVFPRSEQYEYWYIRNKRLSDLQKPERSNNIKCMEVEKKPRSQNNAFEFTQTPFWWQDEVPMRVSCTVGLPNDYAFERLDPPGARDMLIRKKLQLEDPEVYAPGDIYKQEHPEENSMQETLDRADAVRVVIQGEEMGDTSKKNPDVCSCQLYAPHEMMICYPENEATAKGADTADNSDPRWHPMYDVYDVPTDDNERVTAMLKVQKPYLHEMNTWYTKFKPAKSFPPVKVEGKRPILEWHFSNL